MSLSRRLAAQRRRKLSIAREKDRLALTAAIREAIALLQRHGQDPTRRNIQRALSIRKIKFRRIKYQVFAQCQQSVGG